MRRRSIGLRRSDADEDVEAVVAAICDGASTLRAHELAKRLAFAFQILLSQRGPLQTFDRSRGGWQKCRQNPCFSLAAAAQPS
jgi:hypothetical protein